LNGVDKGRIVIKSLSVESSSCLTRFFGSNSAPAIIQKEREGRVREGNEGEMKGKEEKKDIEGKK